MKKIKLSTDQAALLAIMPEGRDVTSTELIKLRYGRKGKFNARSIINTEMRIIMRKLEIMKDGRRITKGPRRGPHPTTFRLEVI